jgi:hypothetical protein
MIDRRENKNSPMIDAASTPGCENVIGPAGCIGIAIEDIDIVGIDNGIEGIVMCPPSAICERSMPQCMPPIGDIDCIPSCKPPCILPCIASPMPPKGEIADIGGSIIIGM